MTPAPKRHCLSTPAMKWPRYFLIAGVGGGAIIGIALSPGMDGDRGALFILACASVGLIGGLVVDAFIRKRR